ncbi:hypothetical protein A2U01_0110519, partial [Trifolium medium]|nr:hypothetical protein [Trifolium medium]
LSGDSAGDGALRCPSQGFFKRFAGEKAGHLSILDLLERKLNIFLQFFFLMGMRLLYPASG